MNLPFMVKLWITELVLVIAETVSASAALEKFPSTKEEILQHTLENTDSVYIDVYTWKSGEYDPFGGKRFRFSTYRKDDGTSESINAIARRSRDEFERLLERMFRSVVSVSIDRSDAMLRGQYFSLFCSLEKDVRTIDPIFQTFRIESFNRKVSSLELGSDGTVAIPEDVFTVDLFEELGSEEGFNFFIPGIIKATWTVEDEQGKVVETRSSDDSDFYRPKVASKTDRLYIAREYLLDPDYTRGELALSYRGGREEVFDRRDGRLLETTLPDIVPVTGIQVAYDTILLTVKAESGDDLRVDVASVLGRWEEQPNPTLTKRGLDERVFSLPKRGDIGFAQVRRVPSTIKIKVR